MVAAASAAAVVGAVIGFAKDHQTNKLQPARSLNVVKETERERERDRERDRDRDRERMTEGYPQGRP